MNKNYLIKFTIVILFLGFMNYTPSYAGYYDDTNDELIIYGEDKFKEDRLYFYFTDATYKRDNASAYISLKGETNLPNGIIVRLFFKRYSQSLRSGKTVVKDNTFEFNLGSFEKEFYPGIYIAEAMILPYEQNENILSAIPQGWIDKRVVISSNVQIGSTRQIVEVQSVVIEETSLIIDNLNDLFEKLVKEYQENKTHYSRVRWLKWSKGWKKKLAKLNNIDNQRNNGKVTTLFPYVEDRLDVTFLLIEGLQKMMYYEFEGKNTKEVAFISIKEAIKTIPDILKEAKFNLIMDFVSEYDDENNE